MKILPRDTHGNLMIQEAYILDRKKKNKKTNPFTRTEWSPSLEG